MEIPPLSGLLKSGIPEITTPAATPALAGEAQGGSFSDLMTDAIKQVRDQAGRMDHDVENLATGKADNLHQVVLNVAEADLTFRLLMEVRDRLITSYQEIMRMQI